MSAQQPQVRSDSGMVAAAHTLAAAAGIEIMRAGGNAFDAVVATAATLNVVEPFMSGLGGLGVATCWVAGERRVRCLDFIPPVPQGFNAEQLTKPAINAGAMASGVPGNLAGWCALHATYGKLPLSQLFAPAIRHARDGFPISDFYVSQAAATVDRAKTPEWALTYLPADGRCEAGWILKQPRLAETFETIAVKGPGCLYGGTLGETMVRHLNDLGGCLSMADLEAVQPEWQDPLTADYKSLTIHVPPPPSEAFQFLLALRILDGLGMADLAHLGADHLDRVFRSIRLAAETRILNNNRSPTEIEALLAGSTVTRLRERVLDGTPVDARTEQFGEPPSPEVAEARSHTTSFSIADSDGNLVCLTQSLGSGWGSAVVIPGTGICMNNFMNWGDLNPASPNFLVGGKRWAMCLSPSISTRDGEAALALGTPGSYGIMQTQAQAMVHFVDYGLELPSAIEAPRGRLFDGRRVVLESRVPDNVVGELQRRGHEIEDGGPFTMQCGGMQAVLRDSDGTLTGAADPRRDGAAIGL